MLRSIIAVYRAQGAGGVLLGIRRRIFPQRAKCLGACERLLNARNGLEIGGPSGVFSSAGVLPIYPIVGNLDNCNFSGQTTWEGTIVEGMTFCYDKTRAPGRQYVGEATDLSEIPGEHYDFLLSSHVIEHSANSIKALLEWMRVVKEDGILVLLTPHKDGTFDHRRPVTPLAHLIDDYDQGMTEADLSHLPEILKLHDLSKDPGAGDPIHFRKRSENNLANRCLHHHVFDTKRVVELLNHLNLQVLAVEAMRPNHIITVARKLPPKQRADNGAYLSKRAEYRNSSPFKSDRSF